MAKKEIDVLDFRIGDGAIHSQHFYRVLYVNVSNEEAANDKVISASPMALKEGWQTVKLQRFWPEIRYKTGAE